MITPGLCKIEGFVKIYDPNSGEVLVDKKNVHGHTLKTPILKIPILTIPANGPCMNTVPCCLRSVL